ncbi:MAG: glycosyltransferase family 2 protein [Synergistaceae bacterium]|nr:glycosyltransferase family 2 protein [Synergistaceae bacterium]
MKAVFSSVSILIPAMDETYSLSQTVDVIAGTCSPEDIAEIIIIISPEKTSPETVRTAQELITKYSGLIKIYIHGQTLPFAGGAVRNGIKLAQGSHLVMMSADLETDPELIHEFIAQSKKYPDRIITASRWKKGGSFKGYSRIKLLCNYVFEKAIAWFYFSGLSDMTFGYRLFPTELMKSIKWEELKHPFFLETALKPLRLGVKFVEIPAKWEARTEGVSQNGFFANFMYFGTAWRNRFLRPEDILLNYGGENNER